MIMLNKLIVSFCVLVKISFAFQSDDLFTNNNNPGPPPNISVPLVYSICFALDSSEKVYWGKVILFEQKRIELKPNYDEVKNNMFFSKENTNLMLKEVQNNQFFERKLIVEVDKEFDKEKKLWFSSLESIYTFKDTVECGILWTNYDFARTYQPCREISFSQNEKNSLSHLFFLSKGKIFAFSKKTFEYIDSNVFECTYIKELSKKRIFPFYDANGTSQEFDKRMKQGLYFNPKQLSDYNFYHPTNVGCFASADAIWLGTIYDEGVVIDTIKKTNECIWSENLYSDSLESSRKKNKKYTEYKIEYKVNVQFQLERPFKKLKWKKMSMQNQKKMIGKMVVGNASCNFMYFPFFSDEKHLNDGKERLFYVNKIDGDSYLAYYSEPVIANEFVKDKDPGGCILQEHVYNHAIIPFANNINAIDYLLKQP